MAGALTVEEIKDPEAVSFLCGLESGYLIDDYYNDVAVRGFLSRETNPTRRNVFCQNEKAYISIYYKERIAVFPLPRACRWLFAHDQYEATLEDSPGQIEFTLEKHEYGERDGTPVKPKELTFKVDARGPEILLLSQEYFDVYHQESKTPEIPVKSTSNIWLRAFGGSFLEHVYSDAKHTIKLVTGCFGLPSLIVRHHESNWHSLIVAISENEAPYRKKAFLIREGASTWTFWELIRGGQLPQRDPNTGKYAFTVYNYIDLGLVNGQRESEQRAVNIQVGMDGMEARESATTGIRSL
jgi:hypothetical protein